MIAAVGGQALRIRATSRFVTGMGIDSPLENGLMLHPLYGVPYWPGSGIKGLMRAHALTLWNHVPDAGFMRWMFGEGDLDPDKLIASRDGHANGGASDGARDGAPEPDPFREGTAGQLVVFDALPVDGGKLDLDVMTPHHGAWYGARQDSASTLSEHAPGDWQSPNPITFVTVAEDSVFQLGLAWRDSHERAAWLDIARKLLFDALEVSGGGAKTGAGYGRFVEAS
jgi:CRISPR-associated protein Cmr6